MAKSSLYVQESFVNSPTRPLDVFVYVVVLNLFVEYLPQVLSETFTLSLLSGPRCGSCSTSSRAAPHPEQAALT